MPSFRRISLLPAILIGTQLSLASCVSERSDVESAAIIAIRDMHGLIPQEGEAISRRFLSSVWQGLDPPQALPAAVLEASGLPARSLSRSDLEDSTTLVLNLFRPTSLGGDSLRVIAEWLVYEPGELFWGVDYQYTIDCSRTCAIAVRHGPGHLN
ncbi:MAG: hypothetical protein KJO44_00550 [Gemmatimonadetes bacterium]|nr:hypothetical protein [Gemmatimonadota bacterium]